MVAMIQTMECYPTELKIGDMVITPAPEPDHENCPKGQTVDGILGGWLCPCPCHTSKSVEKQIYERFQADLYSVILDIPNLPEPTADDIYKTMLEHKDKLDQAKAQEKEATERFVQEYLGPMLMKDMAKELAKAPWWCVLCGEGGNYEGKRPDEYWFPPRDHKCDPKKYRSLADVFNDLKPKEK